MNYPIKYLLYGYFLVTTLSGCRSHNTSLTASMYSSPRVPLSVAPQPPLRTFRSVSSASSVEIIPLNVSVQNDSVFLHWRIDIHDIRVRANDSHVFVPLLVSRQHSLMLPSVVVSGHKRASYDVRERALTPFYRPPYSVSVYRRGKPVEAVYYTVSFPYASWMNHCALELRQVRETTWKSTLLRSDRLCEQLPLGTSPATMRVVAAPADTVTTPIITHTPATPVAAADEPIALFLSYPEGYSGIDALFSNNIAELSKVDRLLLPLLNTPGSTPRTLLVTGYSSPDGVYRDNEELSKKRALQFVRYLRASYALPPDLRVRTAWVAEDWDGVRRYLDASTLPGRMEALRIIDTVGIFDGRERELMNVQGGELYRHLKKYIFPKLRRIELKVNED